MAAAFAAVCAPDRRSQTMPGKGRRSRSDPGPGTAGSSDGSVCPSSFLNRSRRSSAVQNEKKPRRRSLGALSRKAAAGLDKESGLSELALTRPLSPVVTDPAADTPGGTPSDSPATRRYPALPHGEGAEKACLTLTGLAQDYASTAGRTSAETAAAEAEAEAQDKLAPPPPGAELPKRWSLASPPPPPPPPRPQSERGSSRSGRRGTFSVRRLRRTDVVATGQARGAGGRRWFLLPTSCARRWWDLVMLGVALLTSFLTPLQLAFWPQMRRYQSRAALGLVLNVLWPCHVAVSLRTGFEKEGVIVTSPRAAALRYLRSSLLLDLLCCWPDELVLLASGLGLQDQMTPSFAEDASREHLRSPLFFLQLLKASSVLVLVRQTSRIEKIASLNPGLLRLCRVLTILVLTCHWVGSLWWLVAEAAGPAVIMSDNNYWIPHEWRALLLTPQATLSSKCGPRPPCL